MEDAKLSKATSSYTYSINPYSFQTYPDRMLGDNPFAIGTSPYSVNRVYDSRLSAAPASYQEELFQCRFFYRYDPTASTVVNRMAELAGGALKNRRRNCTDEEFAYFSGINERITELLKACALSYLIAGMAVPDFVTTRTMGNRINPALGRKRYTVPEKMWTRNPENIVLKRVPFGAERRVYLRIPKEEVEFILNEGRYPDGTEDRDLYAMLVRDHPDYVQAIKDGVRQIALPDVRPILRKPSADSDYPQPFLVPALAAMKHKMRIKEMDHSIALHAIEAILHVKAGNDDYPVTEDDDTLTDLKNQMTATNRALLDQIIYRFFTNHTVEFEWIYPPIEALLAPQKYEAVDGDIFMAMGFSRVLLVGEANKSNAGAGTQVILGPLAMLEELRNRLLAWVKGLYQELAQINGFTNIPEPFFAPLVMGDLSTLVTQAASALKSGVISKNTYAQMFGSDFETEFEQIEKEMARMADSEKLDQMVQLGQQPHTPPPSVDTGTPENPRQEEQRPSDTL